VPSMTIKQFSGKLSQLRLELGIRASAAMRDTAKQSVAIVRKELRDAETLKGSFPLIASRRMYLATKWNRVPSPGKFARRRVVANIGVFTSYAAAMEYGTGSFTPPLAPLIEWAKYKIAANKRKKTAGKSRGGKIRAKGGGAAESKGGKAKGVPRLNKSGNREARRMAYFVQQKIKNEGILPRFYMAKSMDKIGRKAMLNLRRQGKKIKSRYPVKFTVRRLV
jgi:hypothetical protein